SRLIGVCRMLLPKREREAASRDLMVIARPLWAFNAYNGRPEPAATQKKKSPARHGASLERSPNFRPILSLRPGCGVAAHCWNGGRHWWGKVIYRARQPAAMRQDGAGAAIADGRLMHRAAKGQLACFPPRKHGPDSVPRVTPTSRIGAAFLSSIE